MNARNLLRVRWERSWLFLIFSSFMRWLVCEECYFDGTLHIKMLTLEYQDLKIIIFLSRYPSLQDGESRLPDVRSDERKVGGDWRSMEGSVAMDQVPGECGGRGQAVEQTICTFMVRRIYLFRLQSNIPSKSWHPCKSTIMSQILR